MSNLFRLAPGIGAYPALMVKKDIDPVRSGFGMRLKAARQNQNYTQQQIADRFDIDVATVSAWETGRGDPGVYRLRELSKLYKTSTESLVWENAPSNDAMQFAAEFDSLNETQRRTLYAMWMAYIQASATDAEVEERMEVTKGFRVVAQTDAPKEETGAAPPRAGRGMAGGVQMIGNVGATKGEKHGDSDKHSRVPRKNNQGNS